MAEDSTKSFPEPDLLGDANFYESLSSEIYDDEGFQRDLINAFRFRFNGLFPRQKQIVGLDQIKRLLETSCIFSLSPNVKHQRLALEIATLIWESSYLKEYPGINGVIRLVCSRLGNPAAYRLISEDAFLSAPLNVEVGIKALENTVEVFREQLVLTDFQKEVLSVFESGASISYSAPTSAGKSFIVSRFVANQYFKKRDENYSAVIIVPTRALIQQNTRDYLHLLQSNEPHLSESIAIISTAGEETQPGDDPLRLFILTQERLLAISSSWKQVPDFQLIVIDEAQKIGELGRGVLLEEVVEETLERNPNAQVAFLSPLSENPEYFADVFGQVKSEIESQKTECAAVAQNVYTINFKGNGINLHKLQGNDTYEIIKTEEIQADWDISAEDKKGRKRGQLAFAVNLLGKDSSNIIYAKSPGEAEAVANELTEYGLAPEGQQDGRLQRAIRIIENEIHPNYHLTHCLQNGIGYHYGNMPDIAKHIVEDLFRSETIHYLVCTSTLLEGVNLPAKNIFIGDPKLGKVLMDDRAFWNLAGRAGRLKNDLSGNVYCVGTDEWDEKILKQKSYILKSALADALTNEMLLEYLGYSYRPEANGLDEIKSKKYKDFAEIFCSLVLKYKQRGETYLSEYLGYKLHGSNKVDKLINQIRSRAEEISIPHEIIGMNRSIDPRLQQQLYDYIDSIDEQEFQKFLPINPSEYDFFDYMVLIFDTSNRFFRIGKRSSVRADALLAVKWIREISLREIIDSNIDFRLRSGWPAEPNEVIGKIVQDINAELRFNYLSYVKCIFDLIKYYQTQKEGFDKNKFLSPEYRIPNYLELGLNKIGSILYHNVGFSRGTAIRLNRYVNADRCKTPREIRNYIKDAIRVLRDREDHLAEFEFKQLGFID